MSHTRERPFKCDICSCRFGRRDILQRHSVQVHCLVQDEQPLRGPHTEIGQGRRSSAPSTSTRPESAVLGPSNPHYDREESLLCDKKTRMRIRHTEDWKLPETCTGFMDEEPLEDMTDYPAQQVDFEHLSTFPPFGTLSDFLGLRIERPGPRSTSQARKEALPIHRYFGLDTVVPSPLTSHISLSRDILCEIDTQRLFSSYERFFYPNCPFLHLPSFDLRSAVALSFPATHSSWWPPSPPQLRRQMHRPLCTSILAIGAVYSQQPSLAYKLHEETRSQLQAMLTDITRRGFSEIPLHLIQALLHHVAFGLCSGSEKLEQSSLGHLCSLIALAKEANLAQLSSGCQGDLNLEDWAAWVEAEERKRTFFSLLCITSAAHAYLNDTPDMPITSANLTLPCPEALWEAGSAASWYERYIISQQESEDLDFRAELERLFGTHWVDSLSPSNAYRASSDNMLCQQHPPTPHVSELGCLVLVTALNQIVSRAFNERQGSFDPALDEPDGSLRSGFLLASERWQMLWMSYPRESLSRAQNILLGVCIPYIDHIHLLLHLDISSTKQLLQQRKYDQLGTFFGGPHLQGDLYPPDGSTALGNQSLYSAGAYAISALEIALKLGPWWRSESVALDVPMQSAMGVFHCVHVICSRLVAAGKQDEASGGGLLMYARSDDRQDVLHLMRRCQRIIDGISAKPHPRRTSSTPADILLTRTNLIMLAIDLLVCFADIFERKIAWEALSHLAKGFRARADSLGRATIGM
ncbi:hypothetical protein BJX68DRAFT_268376 [Aspergillus pseudodeflectus]|uniref:C2H2-type domain-containing protein n=1 Tax=Aspergillus pseudodeflectus TaxID=176178 RepID=A0ABR4K4S6_9EURO